jgi:hypothetical protein
MRQQISSTSSSESTPRSVAVSPLDGLRTLAWILAFVALLEVGLSLCVRISAIEDSAIGRYFASGESIESKILAYATHPDLPANSVFYAGWLDPSTWPPEGESNDVAVYGMSYAGNLASALRRAAPELDVRMIGGPGAPLSHSYAAYGMDAGRRTTKVVVITLLSRGMQDMAGLTHDTAYNDHSQPATWPVYQLTDAGVEVKAWPVVNSASALRHAVTEDRALWDRHVDLLDEADANFSRFLYSAHWTEQLVLGRVLRRAWAKAEEREWNQSLVQADGYFDPDAPACKVTREVLRAFIADVRRNGERPIVVLFSEQGTGDSLWQLVGGVLDDTQVPYLTTEDFCDSKVGNHYANLHFVPQCDDLMASRFLEVYREELAKGNEP